MIFGSPKFQILGSDYLLQFSRECAKNLANAACIWASVVEDVLSFDLTKPELDLSVELAVLPLQVP